uniref:Carboxypeptidase n=1 Tax=Schistosoma japonicum TaxID=6182 RepID=C1L4U7_SCHJA|nr:carboxypeptidase C [Schistosoma japonicum]
MIMCYRVILFCHIILDSLFIKDALTECRNKDAVRFFPGVWPQPTFNHFSGYLNGSNNNIRLHYWLVEAVRSPKTAPLILWLNGGPGCSSMGGFFSENGPYNMIRGTELVENPYSWNKLANVLYLESPAGVGFSYAVDNNITTDDDYTALNNYYALLHFLKRFPEYKGREFYITGESYAGVYVPLLALHVIKSQQFNLKGIAVGNGLTNYKFNDNSLIYFIKYHGLVSERMWNDLLKHCCHSQYYSHCLFTDASSVKCQSLVKYILDNATAGLNIYNLYDSCGNINNTMDQKLENLYHLSDMKSFSQPFLHSDFGNLFRSNKFFQEKREKINELRKKIGTRLVLPCDDDNIIGRYLDLPFVRESIHVREDKPKTWEVCSDSVMSVYKRNYQDLSPQYRNILKSKIPILIYNGDVDMACNFIGDDWFVNNLKFDSHNQYQRWIYKSEDGKEQIGGFWKSFIHKNVNLIFTTVRGAGHMVPRDKPAAMFHLIQSFIQAKSL